MIHIRRLLAALAICLAVAATPTPTMAQDSKIEKAREVFRVMQADGIVDQMLDAVFGQMGAMMQQSHPDLPQEALNIVRDEISASLRESLPALLDQMAVVYEQVFTEEELDGMLVFYKSPVGQSMVAKLPQVMSRSVQFSQTWAMGAFRDLPQRVERRLRDEGYKL